MHYGSRRGGSTSSSVKGERLPGRSTGPNREAIATNHSLGAVNNNGTIVKEKQIRSKSEPGLASNTSSSRELREYEASPRLGEGKRSVGIARNESEVPSRTRKVSPDQIARSSSSRNVSPNPSRVERSAERPSRRAYGYDSQSSRNASPNPSRVERPADRPTRRAYGSQSRASERNTSPNPSRVDRSNTQSSRRSYSGSNNSSRQQSTRPSSRSRSNSYQRSNSNSSRSNFGSSRSSSNRVFFKIKLRSDLHQDLQVQCECQEDQALEVHLLRSSASSRSSSSGSKKRRQIRRTSYRRI